MDARAQKLHNESAYSPSHWSSFYLRRYGGEPSTRVSQQLRWKRNTFINIAAQFAILPYLKSKVRFDPAAVFDARGTRDNVGLLESAIFGYRYFLAGDTSLTHEVESQLGNYHRFFTAAALTQASDWTPSRFYLAVEWNSTICILVTNRGW